MLLVIDVGNTNVAIGVYVGDQLRARWRFATDVRKTPDEYAVLLRGMLPPSGIPLDAITDVILSSVVPPLIGTMIQVCEQLFRLRPLVVEAGIRTGIRIVSEQPREVGADRIANAVGAVRTYGGPAIVVDFGTATTFDAISKEGDYLGGAIAPGIGIASEALFAHAAKLPRIDLVRPKSVIGRNTVTAMQAGIIFGYVGLVDGLVERIKRELGGEATVIATGGLAEIIARESTTIAIVDHDLTLTGLYHLYHLNRSPA
ncbi:MAG: type III pantothenate kinase [Chloroflexota bacterium]|nr:type III pantothenate kinase [Dehalococcoidia bacterium]MDW8252698.1 type III pantothenate kinase [Chloroflexota bacterium]